MISVRFLSFLLFLGFFASSAQAAENLALIIANRDYKPYQNAGNAFDTLSAAGELKAAGFEVRTIRNLNSKGMEKVARSIRIEVSRANRVIVMVSGHVVSTGRESYLLTTDAFRSDGLAIGQYGLPLGMLADLLSDKAGSAVLMVAREDRARGVGAGVTYGYVPVDLPQGVTVFTGSGAALAAMVRDQLLVPGTSTRAAADAAQVGVESYGFISQTVPFVAANRSDKGVSELEQLIWDNAKSSATAQGVQTYLDRFPNGHYADTARGLLEEIQKTPEDLAREAEDALRLGRDARREIQRNLTLLGHDTRGVDGIFGRGTRAAIREWQDENRFDPTGYLDRGQISKLRDDAVIRGRELEEEAQQRRLEQERQDAAFWKSTGRNNGEEGLRTYLKRYPDGLYSDIARDRLRVLDEERRRTVAIAEGNAWDEAVQTNTIAGYNAFLRQYPNGAFADSARARRDALAQSQKNDPAVTAAKAEERKILSSPITRLLVERKLSGLGLKPGRVDGNIDGDTRKAVRRFQRAAGLPVTGYVTQTTIVRLLAAQ